MIVTIPGEPEGKKRPRYSRKTGVMYTPSETVAYEKKVQAMFWAQGGKKMHDVKTLADQDGKPRECVVPLKVEIWAFIKPPETAPMWKKGLMRLNSILPTKKPDIDNIGKIILDGLNKAAWRDDSAVTDLIIHKRFSDEPRVVVEINEI